MALTLVSFYYLHLMVDPVQKIDDVAIESWFVPPKTVLPQNTVPNEPPLPVAQRHQRAAAVELFRTKCGEL